MRPSALVVLVCAAAFASGCASRGHLIVRHGRRPAPIAKIPPLPAALPLAPAPVSATAAALPPAAALPVSARPGDCLWKLARRYLGTGFRWPEIAKANRLDDPWTIGVGQVVEVPDGRPPAKAPGGKRRFASEAERYGWGNVPNSAFTAGERLTFAVQYGAVTAGYASLCVTEVVEAEGRPVFHIVAEARTLPFFETFFTVQDHLDSYIDTESAFSWRYEKHIHEGGFKADASYEFDQRAGVIREPAKGKAAPMPIGSQDVLSCFYYFRTQPLVVGSSMSISVTADDMKNYVLSVDVLRKERVSTLAGDFDCVVVQPHLTFNGVFQQKGEVFLWITDDQRRIPVLIKSRILIGSININLQDAEWVEPDQGAPDDQSQSRETRP